MPIETDASGLPILEQFSEEGFSDCVLRIEDLVDAGEFFNFHLAATSAGQTVGMDVTLVANLQQGLDENANIIQPHVAKHGVRFIRSGSESDRLITRLAELYGFPPQQRQFVTQQSFTAIALRQEPLNLRTQASRIKLFGRDEEPFDQDAYFECFFHVDLPGGFVYWNEKDQEYRKPLIDGLSANAA